MNRIKVVIAGKTYILQSTEEEKYVQDLARCLDKGIKEIMMNDSTLTLTSACILAAMDILDEKAKIAADSSRVRYQIKEYIDEASRAEQRADELERKLNAMEQKNKELWNEINLYSLKEKLDEKDQ